MTELIKGAMGILFRDKCHEVLVVVEDETDDSYGKRAGMISIPMGRVKPGEAPQKAAERETSEETGYEVRASHSLDKFFFTHFETTVEGFPFIMNLLNGSGKVTEGELKSFWIKIEELLAHPFVRPPTKQIVLNAVRFLRHQRERASC